MASSITGRTPSGTSSRRKFLQQIAAGGIAIGSGSVALSSCAIGGSDDDDDDSGDTAEAPEERSEENPLGIDPEEPVEIHIFDGGFGDAYATDIHQPIFSERWPDVEIDHNAAVDIAGELQTRFAAEDPPDFINNSGDGQMDPGQLVADGLLHDLTELFDAPSWDDPEVPVRDTLRAGTIESGTFDGKPYILNYTFTVFGIWYNKTLMDENGWSVPTTWDEMLDLCAEIADAGIAPWVYQGVTAPRYMNWPLLTMAAKLAGPEVLVAIDNLEEGAWGHEAVREAASAIRSLHEGGYFLDGVEGMEYRDAQGLWARGEAVFCPSGSWIENEEADAIAEDPSFELAVMPEPLLSEDSVMPLETIRATAGEPYIIPADANNPRTGMEYMRAMLSQEGARGFTEMVTSLTSVIGAADGVELAPGLSSAQEALNAAGDNIVNWFYPTWYKEMENPGIDQATGKLLRGDATVDEWVDECEAVAAEIREDDSLLKQNREL
ncbi:carbohydrate ABC transporter, N-acetylglucosamine/diacetylchitobiose-binding protein [Actinobacteria bacterium YIM 96077]|uniref:Carbohydrate ABC transporter, N-acetylglucosamine/diacetylchitobiose-binding protein n=1 Tax=Phytoactinopolyspora halophila TaxID=1981511 RepID=A0A329QYM6_9ACTN|nr:N-acetylglucosamine/diacetylchitobiose ABC transporter substrate-binding protein [Phytoactinopolyspora halophila]AYY13286.1 carbohydrate ABC transporter, N-acetylglucosamine/diacetylchitobiose-binding protein [Actinobacteria bacterium YIM 96077]RAW17480.1 carbohydrate ABC transporter, N-acetylglucosamine/diacetylchitobiose-binding protein [Phytoactinopolyspora halophila]